MRSKKFSKATAELQRVNDFAHEQAGTKVWAARGTPRGRGLEGPAGGEVVEVEMFRIEELPAHGVG